MRANYNYILKNIYLVVQCIPKMYKFQMIKVCLIKAMLNCLGWDKRNPLFYG